MRSSSFLIAFVLPLLALGNRVLAQDDDFAQRAEQVLHREYFMHPWNETDHTVDGDDWSLPDWVTASRYSGISVGESKVGPDFPGRIQHGVRGSWREVEPREGEFDFTGLRERILEASQGGKYAVKMGLGATVWETRYFKSVADRTVVRTEPGTAPRWLLEYGIPRIEERPNSSIPFQVVNLDIYNPEYHRRYVRMVRALGESGIPQMEELDLCYVHLKSASRGEEGSGPSLDDPRRRLYEERLQAWSEAFKGVEYKLCNVSHREEDMQLALRLGMGQRNGFVEHYLLHAPNEGLGQFIDEEGYLVVDEDNPLIRENRASGDENEEYSRAHELRFGPLETWPHRYKESMLRALQMRRNFLWAEGDRWLVDPPLLHYVALELGKTVETAPDAWCYLRESYVRDRPHKRPNEPLAVKNFERWIYQRDVGGRRTVATETVAVPEQMFDFHPDHLYDQTARRTDTANDQKAIQFAVAEAFLKGGPHRVAVKITYVDRDRASWNLEYLSGPATVSTRHVQCEDTGEAKTVTFLLNDAHFPARGTHGADLLIRAVDGDAVIRMLRVVKCNPPNSD